MGVKATVLLIAIMILPFFSFAQKVAEKWVERVNTVDVNNDVGQTATVDASGSVYLIVKTTLKVIKN